VDINQSIRDAAFLRRIGEGRAALETLKEAATELENETTDKIQTFRPVFLAPVKKRTRFFIKYAKRHGIHLSALLYVTAVHTRSNWYRGRRGTKAGWHQTAKWFGDQIGVGRKQIFRLLAQAKALYLLDFTRTSRGLLVWVKEPAVFREFKRGQTGWGDDHEYVVGYYYKNLANILGLNKSVIYRFLREPETDDDGVFLRYRKLTNNDIAFYLPWMAAETARKDLEKLHRYGVIQREQDGHHYTYFWKKRQKQDRIKWLSALLNGKCKQKFL
jgi:hypothetical protein